jgi:hypothetical protein
MSGIRRYHDFVGGRIMFRRTRRDGTSCGEGRTVIGIEHAWYAPSEPPMGAKTEAPVSFSQSHGVRVFCAAGEGGAEVQPLRVAQAAAAGRAALGTMVQSADGSAR